VAHHRDIQDFDDRAASYERGWRGRWHRDIAGRAAELALSAAPAPARVLDVGCGTGLALRTLAARLPEAVSLVGIDPAPGMVAQARAAATRDPRLQFEAGFAEALPFAEGEFDLVVTVTSFDHWRDQQAGLRECARVLTPGGHLVLTDLFSLWLVPTLVVGRRGRARTVRRAAQLTAAAGFRSVQWHRAYGSGVIRIAVALR